MTRLLAWIFGWPLVWLIDHDGETHLRRAYASGKFPWSDEAWWTYRYTSINKRVGLLPDGKVSGLSYVERWRPANAAALAIGTPKETT